MYTDLNFTHADKVKSFQPLLYHAANRFDSRWWAGHALPFHEDHCLLGFTKDRRKLHTLATRRHEVSTWRARVFLGLKAAKGHLLSLNSACEATVGRSSNRSLSVHC